MTLSLQTGSPCFYCEANAWTSCKHREAEREKPAFIGEKKPVRISGGGRYRIKNRTRIVA